MVHADQGACKSPKRLRSSGLMEVNKINLKHYEFSVNLLHFELRTKSNNLLLKFHLF